MFFGLIILFITIAATGKKRGVGVLGPFGAGTIYGGGFGGHRGGFGGGGFGGFGGGGGGAIIQRFKLNYSTTGTLANTSNLSDGISSVTIDSASGGECTINFTGYYYPPGSIMLYGYDRTNNKYLISHLETTMGQREVPGGGSAGSPTAFDGATSNTVIKLKCFEILNYMRTFQAEFYIYTWQLTPERYQFKPETQVLSLNLPGILI